MVLTMIKVEIIIAVSFLSPFFLNKTSIPNPPDVHNPASNEPKLIVCLINSNVNITDIAQFGIKPINDTNKGWNGEFRRQYFAIFSTVPTFEMINPKINDTININIKRLKVCLKGCTQQSVVPAAETN